MSGPESESLAEHAHAVNEKYEQERQKRLRADGNSQYLALNDAALKQVKDYDADPYTPLIPRWIR